MQPASQPWSAVPLLFARPNVGDLMRLCEENFALFMRLAPELPHLWGVLTSRRAGGVDLHLRIEEQSKYTTQVRLTYFFAAADGSGPRPDPDARLRIYHDARQVEVLELRQSLLPLRADYQHPALADKWQANLFLAKWLGFCVREGHGFRPYPAMTAPLLSGAPITFCS